MHFEDICVSDLVQVTEEAQVIAGEHSINAAGFAIHSEIHKAHPWINAVCPPDNKRSKMTIESIEMARACWLLPKVRGDTFPENTASIDLHTNAGFRIVGTRSRLGCMNGQWRDVVLLERRSLIAGA